MWSICVRNQAAPLASSVAIGERPRTCSWWGLCCFSRCQVSLYSGGKNTRSIAFVKTSLVGRLNCSKTRRWLITKMLRQKVDFLFSASNDQEKWELLFGTWLPAKHSFQFGQFPFLIFFMREILWALDLTSTKPLAAGREDRRWFC